MYAMHPHVYDSNAVVNPPTSSHNPAKDLRRKNPTPERNFSILADRLVKGLA